jgi:hypothetical protein
MGKMVLGNFKIRFRHNKREDIFKFHRYEFDNLLSQPLSTEVYMVMANGHHKQLVSEHQRCQKVVFEEGYRAESNRHSGPYLRTIAELVTQGVEGE